MPRYHFPDLKGVAPEDTPEGLVALGGDLSVENLMEAYRKGIFPWPVGSWPVTWFSPIRRAILDFRDLHVPRSLRQARKRDRFSFTLDQSFNEVIEACARSPRPGPGDTWITPPMLLAYRELHRAGFAHSVEAWTATPGSDGKRRLVGGLYGVDVDGAFAGESMFHREPNASKLALVFLMEYLGSRGLEWIDIQMLTPHLSALGAREISRDEYLAKLAATRARGLRIL